MIKFSRFSVLFLGLCNLVLLLASWVMMVYAYQRLPDRIPFWLNLAGQPVYKFQKSLMIFLYPLAQTVFCLIFWLVGRLAINTKGKTTGLNSSGIRVPAPVSENYKRYLKKEVLFLVLIFLNLIFIHLERSLIWLAHGLAAGVNKVYFFSLIVILLLMIPYYRLRLKIAGGQGNWQGK
ncbi:MAG: DUF1648 domain-containing protein [Candidatus Aminicenantes bacterium]|nr:DUF1648 domain-containing protein [Candidatus Aminicenantes bacterium]